MPLPETGPLSMSQVRTELDLAGSISMGQLDVRDLADVASGAVGFGNLRGKSAIAAAEFFSTTTTSFVVPADVTTLSALAIGRGGRNGRCRDGTDNHGGGGGGGGALSWSNDIAVTPGETLSIEFASNKSSLKRGTTVLVSAEWGFDANWRTYGTGGRASQGVGDVRNSGGNGGYGQYRPSYLEYGAGGGGGGAAGYSGNGGAGATGSDDGAAGSAGSGGAAGGGSSGRRSDTGGSSDDSGFAGASGGGVGIDGEGPSGAGGEAPLSYSEPRSGKGGYGGSPGRLTASEVNGVQGGYSNPSVGGMYGGGNGGPSWSDKVYVPQDGVVRIIWGGKLSFPDNAVIPT